MEEVAVADVPAPPAAPGSFVTRWLPVLLAVLVGCGTLSEFASPRSESFLTREASLPVFLADVDRGLVHSVYQDGDHIVWRPDGARTWSAAPMSGFGESSKPINGLADVIAEAAAVNRSADLVVHPQTYGWRWSLAGLGSLGAVGAFLLLIAGPQPRRATRWGWFWLFAIGRSYGLGFLAFLLLGARPSREPAEPAEPAEPGQHRAPRERIDGFQGFAIGLVGGLAVSIGGAALHDYVVPDRSGRVSYTYDQSGTRGSAG